MLSFFGTFLTPFVIHRLGRNATYVAGILACVIGMVGLATSTIPGLGLGMLGRALSGVFGSVCLILFIVDFIPRANLVRSETLRLFVSCVAWGFGPVIGIELYERYGIAAPAALSIAVHFGLILYFRCLKLAKPSVESTPPPRLAARSDAVVSGGGGDIPLYLLEADARERSERRRQQRRWGLASLVVLVVALIGAFAGGEESVSSSQVYVHLLAEAVPAGADGVVAELLVQPGQSLQRDEALLVIEPLAGAGSAVQRRIEVAQVAGLVDWVGVRVGQQVRRGDPLLTLARPGSAYLLAYFTPEQLRELPQRAIAQIEFDDFPGNLVLGRLGERGVDSGSSGRGNKRVAVRIELEDQQALRQRLRSGMAASVTIRQPAAD